LLQSPQLNWLQLVLLFAQRVCVGVFVPKNAGVNFADGNIAANAVDGLEWQNIAQMRGTLG